MPRTRPLTRNPLTQLERLVENNLSSLVSASSWRAAGNNSSSSPFLSKKPGIDLPAKRFGNAADRRQFSNDDVIEPKKSGLKPDENNVNECISNLASDSERSSETETRSYACSGENNEQRDGGKDKDSDGSVRSARRNSDTTTALNNSHRRQHCVSGHAGICEVPGPSNDNDCGYNSGEHESQFLKATDLPCSSRREPKDQRIQCKRHEERVGKSPCNIVGRPYSPSLGKPLTKVEATNERKHTINIVPKSVVTAKAKEKRRKLSISNLATLKPTCSTSLMPCKGEESNQHPKQIVSVKVKETSVAGPSKLPRVRRKRPDVHVKSRRSCPTSRFDKATTPNLSEDVYEDFSAITEASSSQMVLRIPQGGDVGDDIRHLRFQMSEFGKRDPFYLMQELGQSIDDIASPLDADGQRSMAVLESTETKIMALSDQEVSEFGCGCLDYGAGGAVDYGAGGDLTLQTNSVGGSDKFDEEVRSFKVDCVETAKWQTPDAVIGQIYRCQQADRTYTMAKRGTSPKSCSPKYNLLQLQVDVRRTTSRLTPGLRSMYTRMSTIRQTLKIDELDMENNWLESELEQELRSMNSKDAKKQIAQNNPCLIENSASNHYVPLSGQISDATTDISLDELHLGTSTGSCACGQGISHDRTAHGVFLAKACVQEYDEGHETNKGDCRHLDIGLIDEQGEGKRATTADVNASQSEDECLHGEPTAGPREVFLADMCVHQFNKDRDTKGDCEHIDIGLAYEKCESKRATTVDVNTLQSDDQSLHGGPLAWAKENVTEIIREQYAEDCKKQHSRADENKMPATVPSFDNRLQTQINKQDICDTATLRGEPIKWAKENATWITREPHAEDYDNYIKNKDEEITEGAAPTESHFFNKLQAIKLDFNKDTRESINTASKTSIKLAEDEVNQANHREQSVDQIEKNNSLTIEYGKSTNKSVTNDKLFSKRHIKSQDRCITHEETNNGIFDFKEEVFSFDQIPKTEKGSPGYYEINEERVDVSEDASLFSIAKRKDEKSSNLFNPTEKVLGDEYYWESETEGHFREINSTGERVPFDYADPSIPSDADFVQPTQSDVFQLTINAVQPQQTYHYFDLKADKPCCLETAEVGGDFQIEINDNETANKTPTGKECSAFPQNVVTSSSTDDLNQSSLECLLEQLIQRGKITKACIIGLDREVMACSKDADVSANDVKVLCDGAMGRYNGMMKITLFDDVVYTCIQWDDYTVLIGRATNSVLVSKLGCNSLVVGFATPSSSGSCMKEITEFAEVLKGRGL